MGVVKQPQVLHPERVLADVRAAVTAAAYGDETTAARLLLAQVDCAATHAPAQVQFARLGCITGMVTMLLAARLIEQNGHDPAACTDTAHTLVVALTVPDDAPPAEATALRTLTEWIGVYLGGGQLPLASTVLAALHVDVHPVWAVAQIAVGQLAGIEQTELLGGAAGLN